MANFGDISYGLSIGAGQSVRRNAGDTLFEAYTPGASVPTTITVANEAADTTCFPLFATAATGDLGPKTNAGLSFNSSTANLTAGSLGIAGTAGAGYITLVGQASNPSSPAAGTLLLHSSTANGFTRLEQDNEATTNLIYGRDNVFIAKNTSGGTISKGQVVYVTGSTGNVPNIAKAQANSSATLPSVAVVVDDILNNAFGQVMTVGIISSFDTSAFASGASVWVSTTVAGGLTSTRPSGTTNFVQRIGTILVSGVGNGSLMVNVAPAILNMETGTNAATWTGSAIAGTTLDLTTSLTTPTASFTALAGATTLLTIGGTGASASMFAPSTLDTTSSITGAIRTSGGISAAKAGWIGTDLNIGTAGAVTGKIKMSGVTSGTVTIQTAAAAGTYTLTLPTTDGNASEFLQTDGSGNLTWAAASGGLSWGTSISSGAGTGLAMTTADLAGDKPFITMAHTASGTLTANSTTQFSISTSRTHTAATSVTDSFTGTLFSQTSVVNNAGGTLIVNGPIVKITATDTQTTGTLTPSYDCLQIVPSLRSTGSSIKVNVANSVVTAPTNGHIYAVLGNTQTVAQTLLKVAYGSSNLANFGIDITGGSANTTAAGIRYTMSSSSANNGIYLNNQTTNATGSLLYVNVPGMDGSSNPHTAGCVGIYINSQTATAGKQKAMWVNYSSGAAAPSLTSNNYTNDSSTTLGVMIAQPGSQSQTLPLLTVQTGASNGNNGAPLFNILAHNTQGGVITMQKIDTGTSAQGHIAMLINIKNAATGARGIKIDLGTGGTGSGIETVQSAVTGVTSYGINMGSLCTGTNGSTTSYGIYQNIINSNTNFGTGYGIYQQTIGDNQSAGYGLQQVTIAETSGQRAYGINQGTISKSTTDNGIYGWYVGNLGATGVATGKYFSLNNAQSASLTARTLNTGEILYSRTNTATSGTVADNFNLLHYRRTSIQNGAGGTLTATGSILHLENVATQTAGTLTDSVPLLKLTQDNDSTGGHILFTAYSGTPTVNNTLWYDGTNIKYINNAGVTKTVTVT